ncbi:protein tilB [Teleopsis dalmanni]|uniref:protein tilB n=1 Tax=Teleopsis dalmanni TaxID=139649 RepID=UPI0018CFEAE9|nr:protein tilB [Teleopsis dalmanni]
MVRIYLVTEQLIRKKSEHNECLISTLEELSLHQEDIECIEHLHNWCRDLKILLLQSNLISKIENLFKLKKLEYLNLAVNNIERVENLESLESLNKLDLTLNFIGELTSIESLRANYNLKELILTGNPCCDYPHYREYVIATLPTLKSLDCEEITTTHRLEVSKKLQRNRAIIVQKQLDHAIERDEQKIRYLQQKKELEAKMADIEDEDERKKFFWDSKSEHCPEIRADIARYHKECREPITPKPEDDIPKRGPPQLFAPCGRPYNINRPNLKFKFQDESTEYILDLYVYKFLDTALIDVDVTCNYIRVTVKGKIFQISLTEEVKPSDAIIQRSQITGQLLIRVPKLHHNEIIEIKAKKDNIQKDFKNNRNTELKGTVNIKDICSHQDDCPDLI